MWLHDKLFNSVEQFVKNIFWIGVGAFESVDRFKRRSPGFESGPSLSRYITLHSPPMVPGK
jgi:hypothetical protein